MPGFYVDNAMNRRLGRVGMPRGSMPVSRDGIHLPPMFYVDNSMNRSLGRVGMFRGSMPVSPDDVPLPTPRCDDYFDMDALNKTLKSELEHALKESSFDDSIKIDTFTEHRGIQFGIKENKETKEGEKTVLVVIGEDSQHHVSEIKTLNSWSAVSDGEKDQFGIKDNKETKTGKKTVQVVKGDDSQHRPSEIKTPFLWSKVSDWGNYQFRNNERKEEKKTVEMFKEKTSQLPLLERKTPISQSGIYDRGDFQFGIKDNKETKTGKKTVQVVKGDDSQHRPSEIKTPFLWSKVSDWGNYQFEIKENKVKKKEKRIVQVVEGENSQHNLSEIKTPILWSRVSDGGKDQLKENDKSMECRNSDNDVKQVLYNNSTTDRDVQRQTFVEYEQDSGLDLSSLSIKQEHLLTNRNHFIEGHKAGPQTLYNNSNTPSDNSNFETKENISFDQNISHDSGIDISWSSPKSPSLPTKKSSLSQRKPKDHNEGERNICTGLWVKSKTPSSVKSAAKRQFLNPNRSLGNNEDLSYGSKQEIYYFNDDEIDFFDVQLIQQIHNEWFRDIYMATWKGSLVTVNLLNCHRSNEQIFNSFMDEICLLRETNHPNIVKFLGASITAPNVYLVCEYMQSSVYDSLHMQGTQFKENEKLKIIQQTSLGLAYLHDSNIAHCNITSKNILLNHAPGQTLVVKIANFSHSMTDKLRKNETGGKVCNTRISQYSSPEILRGDLLSVNYLKMADVYSFSLLVFEIIVEKEPFASLDYPHLKENVGHLGLIPVVPDHIAIEDEFHNLMQACWDREPSRRPNAKHISTMVSKLNHIYIFSVNVPRLSALYFSCIMLITLVINQLPCGEVSTGWCIVTLLFIVTCFIRIYKKEISNKSNCNMLDGFGIVDDFD